MNSSNKFFRSVKYFIMGGWSMTLLFLTLGFALHFDNDTSLGVLFSILIIAAGCFSILTPVMFYSVFGKVWIDGLKSLHESRDKFHEESQKYIESRIRVNKWLEKQISKEKLE